VRGTDVRESARGNCALLFCQIVEAFGGKGYFVSKPADLLPVLRDALSQKVPTVVNVAITPFGERKPQEHNWLTRSKL
jgi:thiamine pyrophosphate-dependent acetolactate synthase large subunit-like protein